MVGSKPLLGKLEVDYWHLNSALDCLNYTFIIGTVDGMFDITEDRVRLIAIQNQELNNGDFSKAMDILESNTFSIGKAFEVVEIWNDRLRKHLIEKRGYTLSRDGVIKRSL